MLQNFDVPARQGASRNGMTSAACRLCKSTDLSVAVTYKHLWHICAACGNVTRTNRAKYFWEFLPQALVKRLPRGDKLVQHLMHYKCGTDFYDYYLDQTQGQQVDRSKTKWATETQDMLSELKAAGIDLSGKRVLDISGGPGYFAQDLTRICQSVVVTEAHATAVERMRRYLGVQAVKYDYQDDDLPRIVSDKFDVVFLRYSINFCDDLIRLARGLRAILAPGGFAYVSFVPPTLGTFFRWQFDEYTYPNLYQPETMARCFAEQGYALVTRYEHSRFRFLKGMHPLFKVLACLYVVRGLRVNCDRRFVQRNFVMIFRLGASPVRQEGPIR